MTQLRPGANGPLPGPRVEVRVSAPCPVDVLALLVDDELRVRGDEDLVFWNAPEHGGVRWTAGTPARLTVDTAQVPERVHAVLVVLALPDGDLRSFGDLATAEVAVTAADGGADGAGVRIPLAGLGPERAVIGAELYRRAGAWKVRAVVQGHAEGLAALLGTHGVDVEPELDAAPAPTPAPAPVPAPQEHPSGQPQGQPGGQPQGQPSGQQPGASTVAYADRAWLVWEDASRSLSAYRSATDYALHVRDQDVSGRPTATGHEEIRRAADERLQADLRQLTAELAGSGDTAPAVMAPWSSPAWLTWRPGPRFEPGILAGHLTLPEAAGLRIPLVLRQPWSRACWVRRGPLPGDSIAFGWSLITRYLAAAPAGAVAVELLSPGGPAALSWVQGLAPPVVEGVLAGGVSTGPEQVTARIRRLLDLIDLRAIGAGADAEPRLGGRPIRLTVLVDPGSVPDESFDALLRIAEQGPGLGVPLVCIETDGLVEESLRGLRLRQAGQSLPSGEGSGLGDPWVGSEWEFTPELLPDAAALLQGTSAPALLRHVLAAQQATLP